MTAPASYEKDILNRIAEGNEAAFRELFEKYRSKLYRYIFRITKSREAAEEMVMDVFLKIWMGREMAREIDHFEGFLFRVAQNKAIDFLRAAARDRTLHQLVWDEIRLAGDQNADHKIMITEYESRIRQAVGQLSPQRQLVYQLSREYDLSHDQIASHLRLSRNTIKNHIVESLRFIRGYLSNPAEMGIIVFMSSLFA